VQVLKQQNLRSAFLRGLYVRKIVWFTIIKDEIKSWFRQRIETYYEYRNKTFVYSSGDTVEVDEMCVKGRRKYHTGRMLDQVWVLGIISRQTRDVALHLLNNKKASTMIPLI
jgi:hypothetical protein